MSATLDTEQLTTVDFQPDRNIHQLTQADFAQPVLQKRIFAPKSLGVAQTILEDKEENYAEQLAAQVVTRHQPGTLTLMICNRVARAQKVYKALLALTKESLLLVHSRFRAAERHRLNEQLRVLTTGIVVATQAIEAGVDISAQCLFTELAPWSSLVQRFGRCNRYGEWSTEATVYWIDIELSKKDTAFPYTVEELETARKLLKQLSDVGLESLKRVEAPPQDQEGLLPRRQDVLQLFDTTPDLAGHDIDVSSFIRESSDSDLAIAWREWDGDQPPPDLGDLHRKELCRVSVRSAQKFVTDAWVWDGLRQAWIKLNKLYAGQTLLLKCAAGGYSEDLGWTGDAKDKPNPISVPIISPEADAADNLTNIGQFVTLREHSEDVAKEARQLCQSLQYPDLPDQLIERAARWHDLGKTHDAFQEMMTPKDFEPNAIGSYRKAGGPWAKSDHSRRMRDDRRGFRHELVSALVALQQGEPFLLCYLVAAHHGKVRMTIQPRPTEKAPGNKKRYALGVWEGDICPAVDLGGGVTVEEQELSLAYMELGTRENRESWTAQAIALLNEYGPMRLAFLETIIRLADWRGSAKRAAYFLEATDA